MCGDAVTIRCAEKFGILGISGSKAVIVDNLILHFASSHDVVIVLLKLSKSLLNGLAVASPIAFVVGTHVAHVVDFIIAKHHVAAGLTDGAEVVHERELRHFSFFGTGERSCACRQLARTCKGRSCEILVCDSHRAIYVGQIEVAPVDGNQVSSLAQNLLISAATLDVLASTTCLDCRHSWLTVVIDRQFRGCSEVELDVVLLPVIGFHLI